MHFDDHFFYGIFHPRKVVYSVVRVGQFVLLLKLNGFRSQTVEVFERHSRRPYLDSESYRQAKELRRLAEERQAQLQSGGITKSPDPDEEPLPTR